MMLLAFHSSRLRAVRGAGFAALVSLTLSTGFAQAPAASTIFERVSSNVWILQANDAQGRSLASGSAVAIAPGKAITSCQLLAKASQLSLRRDNVSYGAMLELPDPERDLCQLHVPNLPAAPLAVVPTRELQVGMALYTVGSPRGKELALGVGMLSAVRRADNGTLEALQLAAAPDAGLGGAGVFDAQARLVAVLGHTAAGETPGRLAMPATWLADLPTRGAATIEALRTLPAGASRTAAAGANGIGFRALEYRLVDQLTRSARQVVYRVDEESAERRSLNNGGWIEKPNGEVIRINTPVAGEFDTVMPPGGWVPASLLETLNWSTRYDANHGGMQIKMDFRASVEGRETMIVAGRNREVIRVDYRGYTQRTPAGGTASSNPSGTMRATAWYSPELSRVVRFEIRERGGSGSGAFHIAEELELTAIR